MKLIKWFIRIVNVILIVLLANSILLYPDSLTKIMIQGLVAVFVGIQVVPSFSNMVIKKGKLRICANGCELLILFVLSAAVLLVTTILGLTGVWQVPGIAANAKLWLTHFAVLTLVESVVFWNGILRVYTTSDQLGIRYRVLGIACGMIPLVNLFVLRIMIKIVAKEVRVEQELLIRDEKRAADQICHTKYPILMVHGVFFRDFKYLNYWGRIPDELIKNGATIYYGNQHSAASVEICGAELKDRIMEILKETGAEKVNIIAHSKGGLDSRYAISECGAAPFVASLTTINTPHRGCEFADYLLTKIGEKQKNLVATTYNTALKKIGDSDPDFISAVTDLTASACQKRNELIKDDPSVYYQSVGTKLNVARGGRFPLNFSYHLVNYFDGQNDGLVGEASFPWGEDYQFITVEGKRGISHGDMIDLNRENFDGFDVREFYIQLVAKLKEKGF